MTQKLGKGHTNKGFDREITHLREMLVKMGGRVQEQLRDAVAAIEGESIDQANLVISREDGIDDLDLQISEECIARFALRTPVASDLRLLMGHSKCISDLERIGDEACKIAYTVHHLHSQRRHLPRSALLFDLKSMAKAAETMLDQAIEVLLDEDVELALEIIQRDRSLDSQFIESLRKLSTYMLEDHRNIGLVIDLIFVLKALERIGDHAQNIAEHVIYAVKGKDVRYINKEELLAAAVLEQ